MDEPRSARALILSTMAFGIAFAVWGMVAPMAKTFGTTMHLSREQGWLLVAVPVLLGSVGRLPMGMLTDRLGGRRVFSVLLCFIALPAVMLSYSHTYGAMLFWALMLGMAGTSFAVGVAFTSRWFDAGKQGLALGVYGAGNIGQSVALYAVPALSALPGWSWRTTYQLFAAAAFAYGVVFWWTARDAPVRVEPRPLRAMLRVLAEQPMSWLLSLYYFVTFGGFVALSIGLPTLLQDIFGLTAQDAGRRVAGFVVVATSLRPVGGWLSDRFGGARVLTFVFAGAALLAPGMVFEHIVPFTVGALGVAACIGLGNGAVFKLVPQHFPRDTGTVTGLVGAMGGLGGFFPPLVLAYIKARTDSYGLGFVLLSVFCLACLALNQAILRRRPTGAQAVA